MKLFLVVGTRPNFIKAAPIIKAIRYYDSIDCKLIHTGQHYDFDMSDIFFEDLDFPLPDIQLHVWSLTHAAQTAEIMKTFEVHCIVEKPDIVLVVGDVNSSLACALVTAKMSCKLAHVEAGCRSFNRNMPEEVNRILIDHVSDYLFCSSEQSVKNLKKEGITKNVYLVGDTMYDTFVKATNSKSLPLTGIVKPYGLVTLHRQENVDNKKNLNCIVDALNYIAERDYLVFSLHPRTRKMLDKFNIKLNPKINTINPVGYLHMLSLEIGAFIILTDSGGVQKEAYFSRVPCITLREETEWVETVKLGWNCLVGSNTDKIIEEYLKAKEGHLSLTHPQLYGNGKAGEKVVSILAKELQMF